MLSSNTSSIPVLSKMRQVGFDGPALFAAVHLQESLVLQTLVTYLVLSKMRQVGFHCLALGAAVHLQVIAGIANTFSIGLLTHPPLFNRKQR